MANDAHQDAKGHFTGRGGCEIHTSRSHAACGNAAEGGGCNHQTNCKERPPLWIAVDAAWVWKREWESHHVLCITCVNEYAAMASHSPNKTKIDAVYRATAWCINQQPNLIALPRKVVYSKYPGARSLNLPCHDVDHLTAGGYCDEVTGQIERLVWQKLEEAFGTVDVCTLAKVVVARELNNLSVAFKSVLKRRGTRPAGSGHGTRAAWHESEKSLTGTPAPLWWLPFSMAKDSVAATRPVFTFAPPQTASARARRKSRS